jgi:hypothetical protein
MTDDQMRPDAMTPSGDPGEPGAQAPETAPALPDAMAPDAMAPVATEPALAGAAASVTPPRASWGRWAIGLGVAGVAIVAGLVAFLVLGKSSAPEALAYVPGDAALVLELRMDLPGDQLQATGNLLAHFPGFQDQSTLSTKIDEALKRLIAEAPGSSVDYDADVKPFIGGPLFVAARSFAGMETSGDPTDWVIVATTNGAVTCDQAFEGNPVTTEAYNGVSLSIAAGGKETCAIDGRFALVGDRAGVTAAIDAHKANTGLNTSTRYAAARTALGQDRLATMYLDGTGLAQALPSADPALQLGDIAGAVPEWIMGGVRAENDALVLDVTFAPASGVTVSPSLRTYPPAHALDMTAFAPAGTLAFGEIQGAGVSLANLVTQLQADPQLQTALQELAAFGGIDGLVGWIDEAGFVVFRDGDTPAGGLILASEDAAGAAEKVTALTTVLGLGAAGGDIEISTSTVAGTKVTTVHIPDISVLAGAAGAGTGVPPVAVDFSIAARDRYIVVGVGTNAMAALLGVEPGAGLEADAAFKRALARSLANPQVFMYVAAGASIDWLDSVATQLGGPGIPADMKPYLDPIESLVWSTTGDGTHGAFRMALTVTTP